MATASAAQSAGRHQSITDKRNPYSRIRKPPATATLSARMAIATANTSSAVAHLGSFIRLRAPRYGGTSRALAGAPAKRPVFDPHSQDHKPAEAERCEHAGDRRPHDGRDAGNLAGHGQVVRVCD